MGLALKRLSFLRPALLWRQVARVTQSVWPCCRGGKRQEGIQVSGCLLCALRGQMVVARDCGWDEQADSDKFLLLSKRTLQSKPSDLAFIF